MRIQKLGKFNFFTSYMSQPKFQLETFRAWAGLGSDISYYLNSHHVDLHVWAMEVHSSDRHVTRDTCGHAGRGAVCERDGCGQLRRGGGWVAGARVRGHDHPGGRVGELH